jgi:hypothetical protein
MMNGPIFTYLVNSELLEFYLISGGIFLSDATSCFLLITTFFEIRSSMWN